MLVLDAGVAVGRIKGFVEFHAASGGHVAFLVWGNAVKQQECDLGSTWDVMEAGIYCVSNIAQALYFNHLCAGAPAKIEDNRMEKGSCLHMLCLMKVEVMYSSKQ